MGEFIMKVESMDKKESMMTGECETTMVNKYFNKYYIYIYHKYRFQNFK
jgi:hypothetical protein